MRRACSGTQSSAAPGIHEFTLRDSRECADSAVRQSTPSPVRAAPVLSRPPGAHSGDLRHVQRIAMALNRPSCGGSVPARRFCFSSAARPPREAVGLRALRQRRLQQCHESTANRFAAALHRCESPRAETTLRPGTGVEAALCALPRRVGQACLMPRITYERLVAPARKESAILAQYRFRRSRIRRDRHISAHLAVVALSIFHPSFSAANCPGSAREHQCIRVSSLQFCISAKSPATCSDGRAYSFCLNKPASPRGYHRAFCTSLEFIHRMRSRHESANVRTFMAFPN